MKALRIVEFSCSVLTLVASAGIWILAVSSKYPLEWKSPEWAFMFLIFSISPVVVLMGSYGHAFRNQQRGFYFLFAGSTAMLAATTILFGIFVFYAGLPFRKDLVILLPAVLALLTVLVAAVVRYPGILDSLTIGDTPDGLP